MIEFEAISLLIAFVTIIVISEIRYVFKSKQNKDKKGGIKK